MRKLKDTPRLVPLENVLLVKSRLVARNIDTGDLAEEYGCAPNTVTQVLNGRAISTGLMTLISEKIELPFKKAWGIEPRTSRHAA